MKEINHKIKKALSLAKSIMDYCQGDKWERECTKEEREEFAKLHIEIEKELNK